MLYHFDTTDEPAAVAALLVYAVYRSRDKSRYKISMDMWEQITRFVKAAAKRSKSLSEFLDRLAPKLCCGALNPRWLEIGERGLTAYTTSTGAVEYMQAAEQREFLTGLLDRADHAMALKRLTSETAWVVLLVRARLEGEKSFESQITDFAEESL